MKTLRHDLTVLFVLVTIGCLGRWFEHTPNATPIAATALLAGWAMGRWWLAMLVPVLALGLSDLCFEGGYDPRVMAAVYAAVAVTALLGRSLHVGRPLGIVGRSLGGSLLFYGTTNLAVWSTGLGYPTTWSGLVTCYANALPFLRNTIRGDLFWCGVLFGGVALFGAVASVLGSRTADGEPSLAPLGSDARP